MREVYSRFRPITLMSDFSCAPCSPDRRLAPAAVKILCEYSSSRAVASSSSSARWSTTASSTAIMAPIGVGKGAIDADRVEIFRLARLEVLVAHRQQRFRRQDQRQRMLRPDALAVALRQRNGDADRIAQSDRSGSRSRSRTFSPGPAARRRAPGRERRFLPASANWRRSRSRRPGAATRSARARKWRWRNHEWSTLCFPRAPWPPVASPGRRFPLGSPC